MIEKQTLDINQEFLSSFSDIKKHLDSLHLDITNIYDSFQGVLNTIQVQKQKSELFRAEISNLTKKLSSLELQ